MLRGARYWIRTMICVRWWGSGGYRWKERYVYLGEEGGGEGKIIEY